MILILICKTLKLLSGVIPNHLPMSFYLKLFLKILGSIIVILIGNIWIIEKEVTIRVVIVWKEVRAIWLIFQGNVILIKQSIILNIRAVETLGLVIWYIMILIGVTIVFVVTLILWNTIVLIILSLKRYLLVLIFKI